MKTRIITLCILLVAFMGINTSYAAFPVKHDVATAASASNSSATTASAEATENSTTATGTTTVARVKHMSLYHKIRAKFYPDAEVVGGGPAWPGILALIFGILAFSAFLALPFLLFSIGAVVFGAIGVGHGYSCRLLALIGLILGILALLALV